MKFIISLIALLVWVQGGNARYNPEAARLYDQGLRALSQGEAEKAKVALEKAVALDSTLADAHCVLGLIYKDASEFQTAVESFRHAITAYADYIEAYYELGDALLIQLGAPAKAIEVLRQAVMLDGEHARARTLLGIAYFREHELEAARTELQEAIRLNPISEAAHYTLGLVLLEKEEWNAAIAVFQRVLELDRLHTKAHFSLGTAYRRIGKIAEAREILQRFETLSLQEEKLMHLERYVEQEPDNAAAWYEVGRLELKRQKWNKARVALEHYIRLAPEEIRGYEMLGYLYFQQQKYRQALSMYQNVIQRQPDVATYRNSLGGVYVMLEQYTEAIKQYEVAIRLEPSEARFYLNLSKAYRLAGDAAAADTTYQEYERLRAHSK